MKNLESLDQIYPSSFYIPKIVDIPLTRSNLDKWFLNLLMEISQNYYPEWALELLKDKHNYYGKYFDPETRKFFLNHFARNLVGSINYFFDNGQKSTRFLDVGFGCGNQLLLMAFLGAEVIGCDIRQDVCDLMKDRKKFYEEISGRNLNISIICNDVFDVDWVKHTKFNAIHFQFSFNNIKPVNRLIGLIDSLTEQDSRLVIQDTNISNYYNKLFRYRDGKKPKDVVEALESCDFKIHSLRGGYAAPPILWNLFPKNIVERIDQILCQSLYMSPSYHLMAQKI